jgi:hypothetical protein
MYYIVQYRRKDTALRPIENWLDYGERFVTASGALTQLETGTQYEFRVKAFNTHVVTSSYLGYSGPSASIFGTPLARLAAPANLMLIAAGTGDWTGECAGSCTASAGSTRSSVVLHATASTRDGFYNGTVIRMLSGAVRDASAQIVAYDAPTRTARLSRAFAVAPAAGDGYMISRYPLGEDRVTITWTRVDAAAQYMVSVRQADRSEEYAQAGGPCSWQCLCCFFWSSFFRCTFATQTCVLCCTLACVHSLIQCIPKTSTTCVSCIFSFVLAAKNAFYRRSQSKNTSSPFNAN